MLAVRRETQSEKNLVSMGLSLLAQEDKLYENAESFLEYSFEQYAFGYVQEEKRRVSLVFPGIWDSIHCRIVLRFIRICLVFIYELGMIHHYKRMYYGIHFL